MNVGDYVRTKDGIIQKITDVFNTSMKIATDRGQRIYHYIDIVKSSPQVIDLIEKNDYVNGCKVTYVAGTKYVDNDLHCWCDECWDREKQCLVGIPAKNIKTIVTHEQMKAMQYRVEK